MAGKKMIPQIQKMVKMTKKYHLKHDKREQVLL